MKSISVKDPKDMYVIYLHPKQGFTVRMSLPVAYGKNDVSPFGQWVYQGNSDFFSPNKTISTKLYQEFSFVQVYDLKKWSKTSSVHLGSLKFSWHGEKYGETHNPDTYIEVIVILEGQKDEHRNTLTVINPTSESTIRLIPHQTLEVVIFNNKDSFARAEPTVFFDVLKRCQIEYELVEIKNTVHNLHCDSKSMSFSILTGENLMNRSLVGLPPNKGVSLVSENNLLWSGLYRAYHYYFTIKGEECKKIHHMKNGNYQGPRIEFHSYSQCPEAKDHALSVCVSVIGALKKRLDRIHYKATKAQKLKLVNDQLSSTNYEKTTHRLVNPKRHDSYEFVEGEEKNITIEIAPPHMFNTKLPTTAAWSMSIQPIRKVYGKEKQIPIKRLEYSLLDHHSGNSQRFNVGLTKGVFLSSTTNMCLLGIIYLSCSDDPSLNRTISCFLVSSRSIVRAKTVSTTYNNHRSGRGYRSSTVHVPVQPTHFKVKVISLNESIETGCDINVYEEIKVESSIDKKDSKKKMDVDMERTPGFPPPSDRFL